MNNNHNSMLNEIINIVTGKKITSNEAGLLNHAKKRRKKYIRQRITTVLAVIMVFVVTYAMILPGITMTKADQTLACAYETHVHTEACYRDVFDDNGNLIGKELICGQADWTVHEHTDDCFAEVTDADGNVQKILVCDLPEIKEHHHDASCYDTQKVLVCGQIELHTHAKDCYEKDHENDPAYLICGKTELKAHTHGAGCLVKGKATDEAIIGAAEEASNERLAKAESLVRMSAFESTPVGVVESEQETSNAVETLIAEIENEAEEKPSSQAIEKYEEKENPAIEESLGQADNLNEDHSAQTFKASTESLSVTVVAEDGTFPEDTQMAIKDIKDEDTLGVISDAVEGKIEKIHAVDITFLYDDKEIEPSKPVKVAMTPLDSVEEFADAETQIVHVDHDGEVQMIDAAGSAVVDEVAEAAEDEMTDTAVVFEAESFSIYALVYTVDFAYEIGGQIYDFSLPGGGFVSFTDLVEVLGILDGTQYESTEAFLEEVENVEFSNPELVSISKVEEDITVGAFKDALGLKCEYSAELTEEEIAEINAQMVEAGDWALISLKAFDTEETLTITMKDGVKIGIHVTDDQHSTNTSELQHMFFELLINGETVDESKPLAVRPGEEYQIGLRFKETEMYQMMDNETAMTYTLPEGFVIPDITIPDIDVKINYMGEEITIQGNKVLYDSETKTFSVHLNKDDPNFGKLAGSADTEFRIDVSGSITIPESGEIDLGNGHKIHVHEPHDATVSKDAVYDPSIKKVRYTVMVYADGDIPASQPVNVSDVIVGSALTITEGSMKVTHMNSSDSSASEREDVTAAVRDDKKGFTSVINGMADGETVFYTYTADVDFDQLSYDGTDLKDEVGNTVTITNPDNLYDDPDNNQAEAAPPVHFSDIDKNGALGDQYFDGDLIWRDITWTVTVNDMGLTSLAGTDLTDTVRFVGSYDALPLYYGGNGIHIEKFAKDGTTTVVDEETGESVEQINWKSIGSDDPVWSALGVNKNQNIRPSENTNQNNVWTYHVSEEDDVYKYVITYVTRVNVGEMTELKEVHNTITGRSGEAGDVIEVGPQGDKAIPVEKTMVSFDMNTITWDIEVEVPADGYDQKFEVIDRLPFRWNVGENGTMGRDDFVSWELLSDPVEGERVTLASITENVANIPNSVTFQWEKQEGGQWVGGAVGTGNIRTVKIRVVTKNNQTWLNNVVEGKYAGSYYRQHVNRATARAEENLFGTDTAEASPLKKTINKRNLRSNDGNATIREVLLDANGNRKYVQTEDGSWKQKILGTYPAYLCAVTLTGITEDNIDIHDTLEHPEIFEIVDLARKNKWYNMDVWRIENRTYFFGSDNPYEWPDSVPAERKGELTWDAESNTFHATVPKKENGSSYSYYHLFYYVTPKSPEAMDALNALAAESGGDVSITNTASIDDLPPVNADLSYRYYPVEKTKKVEGDKLSYTLELNVSGARLNGGNAIKVEDIHSDNLSIDYKSINAYLVPNDFAIEGMDLSTYLDSESQVTWDYRGDTGTFMIPDEKHVVITYSASVIGKVDADHPVTNTVKMLGFEKTDEDDTLTWSGGGFSGVYGINLFKYENGHMENGLNGATFRLLDANKTPIRYPAGYPLQTDEDGDPVDSEGNKTTDPSKYVVDTELTGKDVTFTTATTSLGDGYVPIVLDRRVHGLSIQKNTVYYLEEITPPAKDYQGKAAVFVPDFTLYSFLISDNPDYSAPQGVYVYGNGDVAKVRNWKDEEGGFHLVKRFSGNVTLTDVQKNQICFVIEKKTNTLDGEGNAVYEAVKTLNYAQMISGEYSDDLAAGTYRVREENAEFPSQGYSLTTEFMVDGRSLT